MYVYLYTVVTNYLQSVSVTAGISTITTSCRVANSRTKSYCSAHFSPGTPDAYVYTFQEGIEEFTVNCAPGEHNVSFKVSAIIDGNLVTVEESNFVVIVPVVSSSFMIATPSITASTQLQSVSTTTYTTSLSSSLPLSSSTSMILAITPSTSTRLPTLLSSSSLGLSTSPGSQAIPTVGAVSG